MTKKNPEITNAKQVEHMTKAGRYHAGVGLYLEISKGGGKSWIFTWKRNGRKRAMGLGSAKTLSLAGARDLAKKKWEIVHGGGDPIDQRNQKKNNAITFSAAASKYHDDKKSGWRSDKYREQWLSQLIAHTRKLHPRMVAEITTEDVVGILRPLWKDKSDLALRIRERVEKVLDWCKVHKYRDGENPAAWRGHLKLLMPALPRKGERVQHMKALPYDEVPAFMEKLRDTDDNLHRARALEFTILTAARSGEVFGAQWAEIDFTKKLWTIAANRMKAKKPHVVPLSDRALTILKDQDAIRSSSFVFPGYRDNRPMSNTQMLAVLQSLKVKATVHGFRSSFRDWAGDLTRFPRDIIEHALAHAVGDATERSYRRGSALMQRTELMNAWAAYCERPPQADNVIPMERITAA